MSFKGSLEISNMIGNFLQVLLLHLFMMDIWWWRSRTYFCEEGKRQLSLYVCGSMIDLIIVRPDCVLSSV